MSPMLPALVALLPVLLILSDDPAAHASWPSSFAASPPSGSADRPAPLSCDAPSDPSPDPGFRRSLHEPPGHRPVSALGFTSALESRDRDGWLMSIDKPGFAVVVDSAAPASPPFVAEATYPPGFGDGASPVWVEKETAELEYSRLYVCMWVKLSENWQGHDSGVNKIGFVWIRESPMVVLAAFGFDQGSLEPQVRLQNLPGPGPSAVNLRPNVTTVDVARGEWQRWELVLVANDRALADGEIHWWLDGTKVGEYQDVRFLDAGDTPAWERVAWRPIWGGRGDAILETQRMWLDHLYVSGSR